MGLITHYKPRKTGTLQFTTTTTKLKNCFHFRGQGRSAFPVYRKNENKFVIDYLNNNAKCWKSGLVVVSNCVKQTCWGINLLRMSLNFQKNCCKRRMATKTLRLLSHFQVNVLLKMACQKNFVQDLKSMDITSHLPCHWVNWLSLVSVMCVFIRAQLSWGHILLKLMFIISNPNVCVVYDIENNSDIDKLK